MNEEQQKKVCELIKKDIRNIIVDNGEKVLSAGTGVVVRNDGLLLTAKHVVADPEIGFFNGAILVNDRTGGSTIEYQTLLTHNFGLDFNQPGLLKFTNLDLMLLKPKQPVEVTTNLKISNEICTEGTDVIMAGFPDDTKPPFDILEQLDEKNDGMKRAKLEIDKRFKYYMRLLLFKRAMIGAASKVILNKYNIGPLFGGKEELISLEGAFYWLDNHLTFGGSGGPIVTSDGELIGIILEKGFTKSEKEKLQEPSGSGLAISISLINWLVNRIKF